MVEQLPHCDLLRLSLLTGDLSCQLDKSSKSYCQISSTFHHNLKVLFCCLKHYIFHPAERLGLICTLFLPRRLGLICTLFLPRTIGTDCHLFSSTFYHDLKVAILLSENVTSFTRASDCRIPPLFITGVGLSAADFSYIFHPTCRISFRYSSQN